MRTWLTSSRAALLAMMLAGCTTLPTAPQSPLMPSSEPPPPPVMAATSTQTPEPMLTPLAARAPGDGVIGEVPSELLAAILADAAGRSGLPEADMTVVQAEAVVWPDGSLGCPQPGMMYTQALVNGYQVQILAGDQLLDYRATQRGSFLLCESALRAAPVQTPTQ